MYLALLLVGSWVYADFAADPPAAPAKLPIRSEGGQVARPALIPAAATTPPAVAYWPPGTPRHPACNCGGGGCNCSEAGKCVVVDSDCEPGIRRVPTASIAPLPVPAVTHPWPPPVIVSTVAPVVTTWQLRDRRGVLFRHANKSYLERWVSWHDATLAPPVVTHTTASPPATYTASPPVYLSPPPAFVPALGGLTGSWGFSAGCAGGRCR